MRIAGLFEKDAQHPASFILPQAAVDDAGSDAAPEGGADAGKGKDAGAPKTKPGAPIKDAGVKDATIQTKDATAE